MSIDTKTNVFPDPSDLLEEILNKYPSKVGKKDQNL